jgi:hypothetical protein
LELDNLVVLEAENPNLEEMTIRINMFMVVMEPITALILELYMVKLVGLQVVEVVEYSMMQ